jgi:hypothetical protein
VAKTAVKYPLTKAFSADPKQGFARQKFALLEMSKNRHPSECFMQAKSNA